MAITRNTGPTPLGPSHAGGAQGFNYSHVDNEGQSYADNWLRWAKTQPWFQSEIARLGTQLEQPNQHLAPGTHGSGRGGTSTHLIAMEEFRHRIAEMSKKSGQLPPQDFTLQSSGDLTHDSFWSRNPWVAPVLISAGFLTGGMALGALTGGAALPTSTLGLGGSGFAGEAGGLGAATVLPSGAAVGLPTTGAALTGPAALAAAAPTGKVASAVTNAVTRGGTDSVVDKVTDVAKHTATDGIDWQDLFTKLGGGLLSSLNQPQQRQSFRGTKADPVDILSGVNNAIGSAAKPFGELAFAPPPASAPPPVPPPSLATAGLQRNTQQSQLLSPPGTMDDEMDSLRTSISLLRGRR